MPLTTPPETRMYLVIVACRELGVEEISQANCFWAQN
jgi:hypothetical protein